MKCVRPSCPCTVKPGAGYELQGKTYCCKACAEICTDEKCNCSSCDCLQ